MLETQNLKEGCKSQKQTIKKNHKMPWLLCSGASQPWVSSCSPTFPTLLCPRLCPLSFRARAVVESSAFLTQVLIVYFADSEQSTGSDSEVLTERTSCSFDTRTDLGPGAAGPVPVALSSMEEIQVELQCADLWKRFHDIGTEMIITKAGR